jgi:hypothetical protein
MPVPNVNGQTGEPGAAAPPDSALKRSLLGAVAIIAIGALVLLAFGFFETTPPSDPQRPADPFSAPG